MEFRKGSESTKLAVCTFTPLIHVTLLLQNIWPFSLYPVFILHSVFIENIGPLLCSFVMYSGSLFKHTGEKVVDVFYSSDKVPFKGEIVIMRCVFF